SGLSSTQSTLLLRRVGFDASACVSFWASVVLAPVAGALSSLLLISSCASLLLMSASSALSFSKDEPTETLNPATSTLNSRDWIRSLMGDAKMKRKAIAIAGQAKLANAFIRCANSSMFCARENEDWQRHYARSLFLMQPVVRPCDQVRATRNDGGQLFV